MGSMHQTLDKFFIILFTKTVLANLWKNNKNHIKGLPSCVYAFLYFTIKKFIKVFSNVSQLHIHKHPFPDIYLLILFSKMFYKIW